MSLLLFLLVWGAGTKLPGQTWDFNYATGLGSQDEMEGIASDAQGYHYGAGFFRGNVNFGPGYTLNSVNDDVFVTKHAPNGVLVWAVQAGGVNADRAFDITLDPNGFIYVTGSFTQTITFQTGGVPISLTSTGQEDVFIAKLNPLNGNTLWAVRAGGNNGETGRAITVLGNGVYVTGEFKATASFGATMLTSAGGIDAFVTRLDASTGAFQWAFNGKCVGDEFGADISHDATHVYFTGSFGGGTYILGGDTLVDSGTRDIFLSKIDPGGSMAWIRQGGTATGDDAGYAIAAASGKVYVGGAVNNGLVAFLDNNTTGIVGFSTGLGSNAVLCRYDAVSGAPDWLRTAGYNGEDAFTDIAIPSSGDLLVGGYFEDSIHFNTTTYFGPNEEAFVVEIQPANVVTNVWTGSGAGNARTLGVAATICGWVACGSYSGAFSTPPLSLPTSSGLGDMWLAGDLPPGTYLATASPATDSICLGDAVLLSVNPNTLTGIQWQSAPASTGPWTNLPGATGLTHNAQPGTTTWYRALVANACGGQSNVFSVTVSATLVSFTALAARYCADAPALSLTGSAAPAGSFGCSTTGLSNLGSGNASFTPSLASTGPVYIYYTAPGYCVIPDTQFFVIDTLPTPQINGLAPTYCSADPIASLIATPGSGGSYTFPGGAALTDLGNGNATFNPGASTAGTPLAIGFTFTDSHGCVGSTSASTTVTSTRTYAISTTPAASYCGNAAPFNLIASTTPAGVFSGTFPAITPTGPGTASLNPNGVAAGTYTVIYSDIGTCVISDTVSIVIDAVPVLSLSGLQPQYCDSDGPDTLFGSAAPGGSFSSAISGLTDLGNGSASFDPSLAPVGGPYNLVYTFTAANGCTGQASFAVQVLSQTALSFTPLQAGYCLDAPLISLTGSAAPAGTFTASTPGLQDLGNGTATLDPSQAGSGPVQIIYSAPGNCMLPDTQSTVIHALPAVSVLPVLPFYCSSDSDFILTGKQAPAGSFSATPLPGLTDHGNGTATFSPGNALSNQNYSIVYSFVDGNGCTNYDTASFAVIGTRTYTISSLPASHCDNAGPLLMQGSTSPIGHFSALPTNGLNDLGNGSALFDPTLATPGLITVVYGDTGNCVQPDTQNIVLHAAPTAQLLGIAPVYCSNGSIDSLTGSLAPGGSISASIPLLNAVNGCAQLDPGSVAPGSGYWAAYTYTDANGCTDGDTARFDVVAGLSYQLPVLPDSLCENAGSLSITGNLAPLGVFVGNSPALSDLGNGQASLNPTLVAGQNVLIVYGDSSVCSAADSHRIRVLAAPTVTLSGLAPAYCASGSAVAITGSPAGGSFFPAIAGVSVLGPGSASLNPAAAPLDQALLLHYRFTAANGCQAVDSLPFVVNSQPSVALGPDGTLCAGESQTLGPVAVPNYFYTWTALPGGSFSTQSQVNVSPVTSTTYVLQIVNGACDVTDSIRFQVHIPPVVDAGPDLDVCQGDTVSILGSSSSQPVLWTDANGSPASNGLVLDFIAGASPWYSLSAVGNGCLTTDTVLVQSFAPPSPAQAGADLQLSSAVPVVLSASNPGVGSGLWSAAGGLSFSDPTAPTAQVSGLATGLNILVWTVTGAAACPASVDTLYIEVAGQRIPTGFSPNGDGVNDVFEVTGLAAGTTLLVFNRWGGQVFSAADYQNDWAGVNAAGQLLGDDTYYCVLQFVDGSSYAGYVVLKR